MWEEFLEAERIPEGVIVHNSYQGRFSWRTELPYRLF
jgi:hypothetical protein